MFSHTKSLKLKVLVGPFLTLSGIFISPAYALPLFRSGTSRSFLLSHESKTAVRDDEARGEETNPLKALDTRDQKSSEPSSYKWDKDDFEVKIAPPLLLFSDPTPIEMTITFDFSLFKGKDAAVGRSLPEYRKPIPVKIQLDEGLPLNGLISIKGNRSALDYEIPKFKIEDLKPDDSDQGPHPLIQGIKGFSINTHGYEKDQEAEDGFAIGSKTPFREAAVYEVIRSAGLLTRDSRRAIITYIDSTTGEKIVAKNALLLESESSYSKRIGGKKVKLESPILPPGLQASLSEVNLAKIVLVQSMIGNWDYHLPKINENIQQTLISNVLIALINGPQINDPQNQRIFFSPEDFDGSTVVRGRPESIGGRNNTLKWPVDDEDQKYIAGLINNHAKDYNERAWLEAKESLLSKKEDILKTIEQTKVDDKNRKLLFRFVHAFFSILESPDFQILLK